MTRQQNYTFELETTSTMPAKNVGKSDYCFVCTNTNSLSLQNYPQNKYFNYPQNNYFNYPRNNYFNSQRSSGVCYLRHPVHHSTRSHCFETGYLHSQISKSCDENSGERWDRRDREDHADRRFRGDRGKREKRAIIISRSNNY